ncbi:SDR family NAD(P)-dependent oxidoreductase [Microbacterium aurugineum]
MLAVVTGASGGIGRAVCHRLSADGFTILAQYHTGTEQAEKLAQEIEASGGKCELVSADFSEDSGVRDLCQAVDDLFEHDPELELGALVNNAAKLLGPSFAEARPVDFDTYFTVNVKAPFFLSQQLLLRMRSGGSIVNISSAGAHFSSPGDIVYSMTKASVESMTRNLAEHAAASGVRVNAVMPGFTDNGHPAFALAAVQEYMSSFAVLGESPTRRQSQRRSLFSLPIERSARPARSLMSAVAAHSERAATAEDRLPICCHILTEHECLRF